MKDPAAQTESRGCSPQFCFGCMATPGSHDCVYNLPIWYMGKSRTMGAGLASSTISGVNVNQVQIGDKLQGLAPQATHFFVAGNGRAGWNQYRTRTNGNKRNFVFCMNQLGGVGAANSQFKIRGLNEPDGMSNCIAGPYLLKDKIEYIRRYFLGVFPDYTLCLVGEHETVRADLANCKCAQSPALPELDDPFIHLADATRELDASDALVRDSVVYVNSQCSYVRGRGCHAQDLGVHTMGLVANATVPSLRGCGYGHTFWEGLRVYSSHCKTHCATKCKGYGDGTDADYNSCVAKCENKHC